MANRNLFSNVKAQPPQANSRNKAGGRAYDRDPRQALAQFAATGCFNGTFHASALEQLMTVNALVEKVADNTFLAKLALYSRERGAMKDMPAALLAALAARDTALFQQVFDRVVDNGRMLRTLFQMIRSGQFGKKSLSGSLQRAFQRWLNGAAVEKLLAASIGDQPSLRDVLRLARPTPPDNTRRAFYGWLADKEPAKWSPATEADLPEQVRLLAEFRSAETAQQQLAVLQRLRVRWDLLADTAKGPLVWRAIARGMGSQALRMNLNTLQRHGVFEDPQAVREVAARLRDKEEIRLSRQFPYQYFAAYLNVSEEIPMTIKTALNEAAEIACGNVPTLPAPVVIGLDTSGSMSSAVTGNRGHGSTSKMRCVDVAALVAAALLRRNPDSIVIPFDTKAYDAEFDPSDSILSIAQRLAQYGGGGTDCSLPLVKVNHWYYAQRVLAGVVLVSDNESWVYHGRPGGTGPNGATGVMAEWQLFVKNQFRLRGVDAPGPKLINIDLQPQHTTQAPERADILNIGGFSDSVFEIIHSFLESDQGRFV
ncbi:MAG: vWA domain-containing protein, partial [Planctomycetaceae bacterium]